MKRMMALVIVLMLCTLSALAELEYTESALSDGSPVYNFEELSLTMPASWAGKLTVIEEQGGAAFYQKASHDKYLEEGIEGGGFLFRLGASEHGGFSQLPAFEYLGFSETSKMNYYLELPSDYPAYSGDEAIRAEYDAMFADMDKVVAGVVFHDESGASDVQEDAGPTLEEVRYHFEHNAVPRYFYDDPANMLEVLRNNGVYRLWTALADENNVAYPYREEDFTEYWYETEDGAILLQVVMPQPGATPQCYRLYMIYDFNTGSAAYYTVEYDNLLGESAFLCGWDAQRTHANYGGAAILDPEAGDYAEALLSEAGIVAQLAGFSPALTGSGPAETQDEDLALIECPEQGFVTMADSAFAWDYQEGTGITIYTEEAGRIPYVIIFRSEDLLVEPLEYIREQYTPHIQAQYGDDLVSFGDETYEIGGKTLPAGVYEYRLQGYLIHMVRLFDSTGSRTVVYTAKYIDGEGDATLAALEAAIRCFRAD